jgi:transcriptional regulator NrdR family protein
MKHIINRHGHVEKFDERKVYASCYSACLAAQCKPKEAEEICEEIAKIIKHWIKNLRQASSDQIFKKVWNEFKKLHKEAAYMYKTHRIID